MNALALLCNLHADGPRTLQRLRRAGCESLAELVDRTTAEVALALEADEEFAERFRREAVHLMNRVEGGLISLPKAPHAGSGDPSKAGGASDSTSPGPSHESGSGPEDPDASEGETPCSARASCRADGAFGYEHDYEVQPVDPSPHADRIGPVLAEWCALDQNSPLADPNSVQEFGDSSVVSGQGDMDLEEASLPGMTRDLAGRFDALGVNSMRRLLRASAIELSQHLPLSYTRVKRFQFLAERVLEDEAASASGPGKVEGKVHWAAGRGAPDPPRRDPDPGPDWVETAGPFA